MVKASVRTKEVELSRKWTLLNSEEEVSYFEHVYKLGEKVSLPVPSRVERELFTLSRRLNAVTEDATDKCAVTGERVEIRELKEGKYELSLLGTGRSVSFKVEKGDAWEKENQIYKKNQGLIYEIPPNQDHFLCLGDP